MKSFREAFPTPDALDDTGCQRLMAAILLQAASDYYDCLRTSPKSLAELREFLGSRFYQMLTDIPAKEFEWEIQFRWRNGVNLSSWIRRWGALLEAQDRPQSSSVYYEPQYLTNLLHDRRYKANWTYDPRDHSMKPKE